MTTLPERAGTWFVRGGWWFPVHVLSFGMLAVVPYTHAAVRSRRPLPIALAAAVWVLTIVMFVLIGAADTNAAGQVSDPASVVIGLLAMFVLVAGLAGLIVVRHQVYGRGAPASAPPPSPAMAGALAARSRREEARRIVATDPLLARDLRIGRPDLHREHDDGGLVDLNSAPAPVIAEICGLEPQLAGRIVQARQAAGRFAAVDDVFAYTDLPYETWDRIRDRAVTL